MLWHNWGILIQASPLMTALFAPLSAIIASLRHRKAFGMSMLQIPRKNLLKEHFSALCFPSFTAEPRGRFYSFELSQIHFQFPFSHENSFFLTYSLAASIQFLTFFFLSRWVGSFRFVSIGMLSHDIIEMWITKAVARRWDWNIWIKEWLETHVVVFSLLSRDFNRRWRKHLISSCQ